MRVSIGKLLLELLNEIRSRKWSILLVFFVVSFSVLVVGLLWKEKFTSSVTIFVDDQNIIRPLMAGAAVTTGVTNTTASAKEVIYSRNLLLRLVETPDLFPEVDEMTDREKEEFIALLRKKVAVKSKGKRYFLISFTNQSPLTAFRVAQKLGQFFIEIKENKKKAESKSAYSFIDKQVKAYQEQLSVSGEKLKEFLSQNMDGTEPAVNRRISDLRSQVEGNELDLKEFYSKRISDRKQLEGVNKTIKREAANSDFKIKIDFLQRKLDELRLSYHDSYPDIVSLKQQISDLNKARNNASDDSATPISNGDQGILLNPLYQTFRGELAKTETSIKTATTRISSLKLLLVSEEKRMERIQNNKTKVAELTRDNEVNRGIYNDLLKKREQARVSMHLDIEGKGLTYKIHEQAQYPLKPNGLYFRLFAMAGMILGSIAPVAAIFALLQVDPRVRYPELFKEKTGVKILETVGYFTTPYEFRRRKLGRFTYVFAVLLVIGLYISITYLRHLGII